MSKTITLKKVPTGGIFTLDGVRFVKLDEDYEATLVLTEKELLENIPFEAEDADREDHNNYFGSFIDRHIEKWVRDSHKPIFDATVERPIDLTTMDGMKDYGNPLVVGRILTIDEYRKYHEGEDRKTH